jgi:RNA polymerase sigma-70 factor (ECF subfamily)
MSTPLHGQTQTVIEPPHESADVELVRAAKSTPRAFAPLYLRYRDSIMNYCYYRLGNREESEDATSVIFIKALDHLPRFVERGDSFRTWLFRIAHNEIADRHRQRARHADLPLDNEHDVWDAASPVEDAAIVMDNRLRVREMLAQLPPRERAVLELRTAELNTREIAEVLQISEQNVRTAQSRAVNRLRGLLLGEESRPAELGNA